MDPYFMYDENSRKDTDIGDFEESPYTELAERSDNSSTTTSGAEYVCDSFPDNYYSCSTSLCHPNDETVSIDVEDSCDRYKELITIAFCLLRDNMSLLRASVLLYGTSDHLERVVRVLEEGSAFWFRGDVDLQCVDLGSPTASGGAVVADSSRFLNRIRLNINGYMDVALARFQEASEFCGKYKIKGQACIAIDVASSILHEIFHLAYLDHPYTYYAENYFKYWMLHNYCVLGWGCCHFNCSDLIGRNKNVGYSISSCVGWAGVASSTTNCSDSPESDESSRWFAEDDIYEPSDRIYYGSDSY